MKHTTLTKATSKKKTHSAGLKTSAGPKGVAIAPPKYGIDVVDSQPVQAVSEPTQEPLQPENKTGLPDNLKAGLENLSGLSAVAHSVVQTKGHGKPGEGRNGVSRKNDPNSAMNAMNPFTHIPAKEKRTARKSAEELLFPSLYQHKPIEPKTVAEYAGEFATGGVTGMIEKSMERKFNPQGRLRAAVKPKVPAGKKRALIGLTGEALNTAGAATGLASSIDPAISPALSGLGAALTNYSRDASKAKAVTIGAVKTASGLVESKAPYNPAVSAAGLVKNIAEAPGKSKIHAQALGFGRTAEYPKHQTEKALSLYDLTEARLNEMDQSLANMSPAFFKSNLGRTVKGQAIKDRAFLLRQRPKTADRTDTPIQES